jgi:integrase/recombinase XerC
MFLSNKSERTITAYSMDLEDFARFLALQDTIEACRRFLAGGHGRANAIALAFEQDLIERGLQPSTVNRRLAALRSVTCVASTLGMIPWKVQIKNEKTMPYRDTTKVSSQSRTPS